MEQKAGPDIALMRSVVSPAWGCSALGCTRRQEWLHCGTRSVLWPCEPQLVQARQL